MTIFLQNSLTRKKEEFTPLQEGKVGMYACGPTVYDYIHVGNARALVVFDMLYRLMLEAYGNKNVTYVRNITDIDDKINNAARERKISIGELTKTTTERFHSDAEALQCLLPNEEPLPTKHIPEIIKMIEDLIANDHAYEAEGHVLFHVASDDKYGHLSRRSRDEMIAGARVEVAPYKKDPGDFVLWKPSTDEDPGWDSPWGRGRPGWHIECSVMSTKYLGETFDIHGGGADLQFPHHENEIAQSCGAYPGSSFAKYWVHNGFVTVEGEKMSKSLGNFTTVHELLDEGIQGEVIRYVLLLTHYRKPLDFNRKALDDAKKALDKFYEAISSVEGEGSIDQEIIAALEDDMNTPKAIAKLHTLVKDPSKAADLKASGQFLGLLNQPVDTWLQAPSLPPEEIEEIEKLITERNNARQDKRWSDADAARDALTAKGIVLKDSPDGTTSWKVS